MTASRSSIRGRQKGNDSSPPILAVPESCREGQLRINQPRRDDVRARSGQRWAMDPEACRRSGVVGGVGRGGASTAVWTLLRERYPDQPINLDDNLSLDLNVDSFDWIEIAVALDERMGIHL